MTYEETLHYLYTSTPVFQHSGAAAYKPGLDTSRALDEMVGSPHRHYWTIHVAGTNGKGSVSHLMAAILQKEGYKVGLYTSPHLMDFRERIRVNGEMIPCDYVVEFVEKQRSLFEPLHPSFFELTSTLAFDWFREAKVDFAIIETGLGGRLDSTNIISPLLSLITSIGLDHTYLLGDTLEQIAFEKAGIIKPHTPVVVGKVSDAARQVFVDRAMAVNAPIYNVKEIDRFASLGEAAEPGRELYIHPTYGRIQGELQGRVQRNNAATVFLALDVLNGLGVGISTASVVEGFRHVTRLTGLQGRWQQLQSLPTVVCDVAHNADGWHYIREMIAEKMKQHTKLHLVIGVANDKDVTALLAEMPKEARFYFTQASVARALPVADLVAAAGQCGMQGVPYPTVASAIQAALQEASPSDFIFIGGSSFVVADALLDYHRKLS